MTKHHKKPHANWSPYDNSGGTCVAIAGGDYCVIAADTRMSSGSNIRTGSYFKICTLADNSVVASPGFQDDVRALQEVLADGCLMSCRAMAHFLSKCCKSYFPSDAFNVLGGLDDEGKGCVFTYDAVGSYERVGYSSQGSGSTLIMLFLDNQLKSQDAVTPLSELEAIDLVKTCFASATERDICTGDKLEMVILNADGIRREFMELRKD